MTSADRIWSARIWSDRIWSTLSPAARTTAVAFLLAIATLPVLSRQYLGRTAGEIPIFMGGVEALLAGRLYGEHVFEYPPYALIWFLAPYAWAPDDAERFRFAFGLQIWLFDAVIKAVLLWRGIRARQGVPDLIPFLVYSLGSAALGHMLLMKYDAVPAALALAGVLAVCGGRPFLGGAVTALAAGSKAYPVLFIPILAVVAWRRSRHQFRRFALGVAVAAAPLLLLALWLPWWNFASFHGSRGLEVGSLAASIVWALHFLGVDASWGLVGTSNEVGGPLADQLLAPARAIWVLYTLAALGVAVGTALRQVRLKADTTSDTQAGLKADVAIGGYPTAAPEVAALLLLPLVPFVATNTVFSPQFHLWLIPLAALVLERRDTLPRAAVRAAWVIFIATMIVPTFYPSREYTLGLGLWRTVALLIRNGLLLYAAICLVRMARDMRLTAAASGT
ncbi:MAG: glycosyltransferase 87 family protein [Vicinamibacterales bacterium]